MEKTVRAQGRKEALKMKKLIAFGIALLLMVSGTTIAKTEDTTTAILVYMTGGGLEDDALVDIWEMSEAKTGENVAVVLEAGGSGNWDVFFEPDTISRCLIYDQDIWDLQTLPNQNMGDPNTLVDFLAWAVDYCPADRYMLIFWDHGGGTGSGCCWDESNGDDYLSLREIAWGLERYQKMNPGFHLDLIGFDACLMATYELAASISPYADFMVASEETVPSWAWDYTAWISALGGRPNMDSQSVGTAIVDTYMKCSAEYDPNEPVSLSMVYLPAVPALTEKLEDYSAYLTQALNQDQLSFFSRSQRRMYAFGDYDDASSGCVDFMAFLDGTRTIAPKTAAEVEKAYKQAVRYSAGNKQFDYLTGLSIFFPKSMEETLDWDMADCCPVHVEFVKAYTAMKAGGNYVFQASAPAYQDAQTAAQGSFLEDFLSFFHPEADFSAEEPCYSCATAYPLPTQTIGNLWNLPPVVSSLESDIAQVGAIVPQEDQAGLYGTLNPLGGYSVQLPETEIQYLASAEGQLYMDVSDGEMTILMLVATMQDVAINWDTGEITSLYDGLWPVLGDQLAVTYDVVHTASLQRSTIPVKLNGQEGYILASRKKDDMEWTVIGFTRGYDAQGMPMKGIEKLQPGDMVVPTYDALYWEGDDEPEVITVDGDPVTVGQDGKLPLASVPMEADGSDPISYLFAFELEDIFGETQLTDFTAFEI